MRWLPGILLVAACYAPHAQPGIACGERGLCPSGLVCAPASNTCELTAGTTTDANSSLLDGPVDAPEILIDGCTPIPEICGDGIDQDCNGSDAICPPNDRPDGAIDITAGGTFQLGIAAAHADDTGHGCGPTGGRDVFYKVSLSAPTVFYLDTFSSNFDTVIRTYPGHGCGQINGGDAVCNNDACGSTHSQLAQTLPAGTTCIVIAQATAAETSGGITLHAVNTGHTGTPLPAFVNNTTSAATTTTCVSMAAAASTCSMTPGPSLDYYFLTCPGPHKVDLSDCDATWDSVAYLRSATYSELACNDDSSTTVPCAQSPTSNSYIAGAAANGPALFWAGIGGATPTDCGSFTLTATLH